MANQSQESAQTLLKEIEADIQQEKVKLFFAKYWKYIVSAVGVLIVGTTLYAVQHAYHVRQMQDLSSRYNRVMTENKLVQGDSFFDFVHEQKMPYSAMAALSVSIDDIEKNRIESFSNDLKQMIAHPDMPPLLKGVAEIRLLLLASATRPAGEVLEQVKVWANGEHPFRYTAFEIGALAALELGDIEQAKGFLGLLTDDMRVPSKMRSRASYLLQNISSVSAKDAKKESLKNG